MAARFGSIFFTTSFDCLRFASTSLVAPLFCRERVEDDPISSSPFVLNFREIATRKRASRSGKIWIRISRLTEISIITREPANFSVPDNFLLLLDPSTDHRPGLNLDAFIESLVIFIASWSIDKIIRCSWRNTTPRSVSISLNLERFRDEHGDDDRWLNRSEIERNRRSIIELGGSSRPKFHRVSDISNV